MYYKTPIQYVLQNTNPVCITKQQFSMYYQTLIQYVLQTTNPVCITKH
jgi:aspartate carbamoyltransferase regulatory subunit